MKRLAWLFVLMIVAAPEFALPPLDPYYQDPPPSYGGGGGSSCSYCSQSACGCAPPPAGYILRYSCTCSSTTCTQSCDYQPR